MAVVQYFRVPVFIGSQHRSAYFYESETGLFDLQYGCGKYTRRMHDSLREAMGDFLRHLQSEHSALGDGLIASLGEPVEVHWDEVKQASPAKE